jgi:hypothetical protein
MASDRARAKLDVAIGSLENSEPAELATVLSSGASLRQELAAWKEEHRHLETMRDKEIAAVSEAREKALGTFGKLLGGRENSPIAVASVAILCALLVAVYCLHEAVYSTNPERWFHEAETMLAIVTVALGYIFGKSSAT